MVVKLWASTGEIFTVFQTSYWWIDGQQAHKWISGRGFFNGHIFLWYVLFCHPLFQRAFYVVSEFLHGQFLQAGDRSTVTSLLSTKTLVIRWWYWDWSSQRTCRLTCHWWSMLKQVLFGFSLFQPSCLLPIWISQTRFSVLHSLFNCFNWC